MEQDSKICSLCKQEKLLTEFWLRTTGRFGRASRCIACMSTKEARADCNRRSLAYYNRNRARLLVENRVSDKKERQKFKDEAFAAYGGYLCACCGETIKFFLAIDHIDGWPPEIKRAERIKLRTKFYRWLKRHNYPPGFQVLCHNCNQGRALNAGICPHQLEPELTVRPALPHELLGFGQPNCETVN